MNGVHSPVFIHWVSIIFQMDKRKYLRFKYSEQTLAMALTEIKSGIISINKASSKYAIPKSTLHNKINKKVPNIRKMGPSTVLAPQEEDRLVKWILSKAKLGFPMHPESVKDAVQNVLKEVPRPNKFLNNRPGTKWLKLFLLRHPEISKRNTEIISRGRAAVTEVAIRKWFAELQQYLQDENVMDVMNDPGRIFNADETGMRTCIKSGLVLGPAKNFKNFYEVAVGNEKESITVLCNYAANGIVAPPMIVFPYKRIPKELALSVPKEWAIGRSDSGWMTSATFYEYIANVFYPWLVEQKITFPVILFIDGHKSHYNLELYEFCVEKRIIIYCLYPNSTHILQPCDVSIFRPLKVEWKAVCRNHKTKSSTPITRHNFSILFKEAFDRAYKVSTVVNGFRICGLYPLNPDAVDFSKCISTRRNEIFQSNEEPLTTDDYKTCLRVLDRYFSNTSTTADSRTPNDGLNMFFQFCKIQSVNAQNEHDMESEEIEINKELFTASFIENLPMEIDGILYEPQENNGTGPLTFEETTFEDTAFEERAFEETTFDKLDAKLDCVEILESIIDNMFDIIENKIAELANKISNRDLIQPTSSKSPKINIISDIIIPRRDETNIDKIWEKHLGWPKHDETELKNRKCNRKKMPFAITSTKWVEYHEEQEKKKTQKVCKVKKRKLDAFLKKEKRACGSKIQKIELGSGAITVETSKQKHTTKETINSHKNSKQITKGKQKKKLFNTSEESIIANVTVSGRNTNRLNTDREQNTKNNARFSQPKTVCHTLSKSELQEEPVTKKQHQSISRRK